MKKIFLFMLITECIYAQEDRDISLQQLPRDYFVINEILNGSCNNLNLNNLNLHDIEGIDGLIVKKYNNEVGCIFICFFPHKKYLYFYMYEVPFLFICLNNNKLKSVDNIRNLSNLVGLSLYNNKLKILPDLDLPNLRFLNINNNELIVLPNLNLPSLKILGLKNNKLRVVSNLNLLRLKQLFLSNNKIVMVSELNLPNLLELDLSNNKLKTLSNLRLRSLSELNLNNNELITIFRWKLPNLATLDLRNNKLIESPDFNSLDLPFLHYLYMNHNELNGMLDCNFRYLYCIDLSNNKLTKLPKFKSGNLKILCLNNNELSNIPSSICDFRFLIRLSLLNNELTTLPESITELNLTYFNIFNNKLNLRLKELSNGQIVIIFKGSDDLRLSDKDIKISKFLTKLAYKRKLIFMLLDAQAGNFDIIPKDIRENYFNQFME